MQKPSRIEERLPVIPLVLICLLALWLRVPGIKAGMPYFYAEDEAHHFNRTVEMVKEGRYDPQYFHKPSLHFYVRMPIVALSYLWSAKHGYLRSVKDIETRNSFGLAGYAFTASHPGIVKWNRTLSVALSILAVLFTFLLSREVTGSASASLAAALLLAVSPEFLINSPIIGVDILMALMCVVSAYAAVRVLKCYSVCGLCVLGLLCGLAVSSKYNAAPIAVLPIAICFGLRKLSARELSAALLMPIGGFFLGSPFILTSIPLFLDHLSYEIWHYGVAGHEGHSAEPGLQQARFYLNWLAGDGIGLAACILALPGLALLRSDRKREAAIFLVYPVLFAALMIAQKANFTRNMVSLLPFVAILAASGLHLLLQLLELKPSLRSNIFWIAAPILCLQPLIGSLSYTRELRAKPESRRAAAEWIAAETAATGDVAISGELQFQTAVYRLPGKSRVDTSIPLGLVLFQSGFTTLVAGPEYQSPPADQELFTVRKEFDGVDVPQRLIDNPKITVLDLKVERAEEVLTQHYREGRLGDSFALSLGENAPAFSCQDAQGKSLMNPGEDYCWLQTRFSVVSLPALPKSSGNLVLSVMTPWNDQSLTVTAGTLSQNVDLSQLKPGAWSDISISLTSESLQESRGLLFQISQVHSPTAQKLNNDIRRLGLAIKSARFMKK